MAQRRDSVIGKTLRTPWARLGFALVALAVAGLVWWWLFGFFRDQLQMEFLAWPAGVLFALLLYWGVGLMYRRFGPKARPGSLSAGALARETTRRLTHLPDLTHTKHPLGHPWPMAVIGPTGVFVLEPKVIQGQVGLRDNLVTVDHIPASREFFGDVKRLLPTIRELLEREGLQVPVRGILVTDESTIVPANLKEGDRELLIVPEDQLLDVIEFGQAVLPETVRRVADIIERWRPAH